MKINKDKITKDFIKAFNQQHSRHMDEILWHGSVDSEGGFILMAKQNLEDIELGKKYGVIE